jgi:hypothetical protein
VAKTVKRAPAKTRPRARAATDPPTLTDLVHDPENRRKRTSRNLSMIVDSLKAVGAARSIVIDEDNVVRAGNGVFEGALAAGITKLQIIDADGDTLIAVRRRGLSDAQKRDLGIYDNRTAELAAWDVTQLAADQKAGLDLKPFFFDAELQALLAAGGTKSPVSFMAVDENVATEHTCPKCGYEWSGKG